MNELETRCPHCNNRKFASHPEHNYHKFDCPEQTKEQLIESVRKSNAVGHCYAERIRNLHTHITQWQGKFHTLRLENNALRKQVAKQPKKSDREWHNPERFPKSILTGGRRFLTVEEAWLPDDAEIYLEFEHRWCGAEVGLRSPNLTYATKTVLPPTE